MSELGLERGGVGRQVLVRDVQHLGHRVLVADDDLTGLGDRAMVVDILKCYQEGPRASGGRAPCS